MTPTRAIRPALMLIIVLGSLVAGAIVARAADVRLDEAQLTLEKAEGLLLASQSGFPPGHVDHKFQQHVARAIELIHRASAQIEQAKNVVDSAIADEPGDDARP